VLKYWADTDYQLPAITFWMMGGFDGITWTDLYPRIFIIIPGSILLIAAGFKIDILSLGDEEAKSLGQNVRFLKAMIILLISLITASIVSGCGIIGWVGLAVPHMMRMLLGPSHGRLLIWSGFTGAAVLLAADLLARTITSGEIPIGIITAFMGAPFFAWLLYKKSDDLWK
jgi:iron complex transport system permease protein